MVRRRNGAGCLVFEKWYGDGLVFSVRLCYDWEIEEEGVQRMRGKGLVPLFLTAEGALYAAFLTLDLSGRWAESTYLKYLSIALCLALALAGPHGVEGRLTAAALALTLLADTFLLLYAQFVAGVAAFCGVQLLYLARIRRAGGWPVPLCLLLRAGLAAGALVLLGALGALSLLTGLAAGYFVQLLCNALESLTLRRRGRSCRLMAAGLWLFVGCDLCVGLHNLPGLLPVDPGAAVSAWAAVGMWLFYLPSQVLLALSGRGEPIRKGGMP